MFISHFFLNATATTEIYTLSYTTLFRSRRGDVRHDPEREHGKAGERAAGEDAEQAEDRATAAVEVVVDRLRVDARRSEEHTSELQSHVNLVCRLLLEKKKKNKEVYILNN